jgi:hypothetical protein
MLQAVQGMEQGGPDVGGQSGAAKAKSKRARVVKPEQWQPCN